MSPGSLVSVVIPSYNVEKFLREAVGSVQRQTWKHVEAIVVDDGSTDGTGRLAEELAASDQRVRVIHKRNGGLSSARNSGIAAARGAYLSFLDADDVLLPDKVERQLALLDLFPSCDLVYSDHYVGDGALPPILLECRRPPDIPMQELLLYRNWFAPMSPVMRIELQRKVGLFDETLTSSEDWDFWLRASRCGVFAYLPGPVAVYRTHPGQMHRDTKRMQANAQRVIRKHFAAGSRQWHIAHAAMSWYEANRSRVQRRYGEMTAQYLRCLWHARSGRTLANLVRLKV